MATLKSNLLFFTTSPRTPMKMVPEIKLIGDNFTGKAWNNTTQKQFMKLLANQDFFEGSGSSEDPSFSARDRINRAPKALGFVDLTPTIQITDAGRNLINSERKEEVLLRQILKFQLPSPFHKTGGRNFFVKPYLEIFRLIRDVHNLTFDELMIFGLQLTNIKNYDNIRASVLEFRTQKTFHRGHYKDLRLRYLTDTINIHAYRFNS